MTTPDATANQYHAQSHLEPLAGQASAVSAQPSGISEPAVDCEVISAHSGFTSDADSADDTPSGDENEEPDAAHKRTNAPPANRSWISEENLVLHYRPPPRGFADPNVKWHPLKRLSATDKTRLDIENYTDVSLEERIRDLIDHPGDAMTRKCVIASKTSPVRQSISVGSDHRVDPEYTRSTRSKPFWLIGRTEQGKWQAYPAHIVDATTLWIQTIKDDSSNEDEDEGNATNAKGGVWKDAVSHGNKVASNESVDSATQGNESRQKLTARQRAMLKGIPRLTATMPISLQDMITLLNDEHEEQGLAEMDGLPALAILWSDLNGEEAGDVSETSLGDTPLVLSQENWSVQWRKNLSFHLCDSTCGHSLAPPRLLKAPMPTQSL